MQDYKAEPSYGSSRVESPPRRAGRLLIEQFGELLSHGATELLDYPAQMPLEIVAGVHGQRRIVDGRAVGDHHQDLALFAPAQQPLVRPIERFAVDILLQ